jgi:hypothetical protein
MVKRNRTDIAREIDKPLLDNASTRHTSRTKSNPTDDVIMTLSNAYENKRARQVIEWERAQSMYVRQAV